MTLHSSQERLRSSSSLIKIKEKKIHPRKDSQKKEPSNVDKKKDLKWDKCKKIGHIKYDYPLYKNEVKRGKKKVMMVTWSESEE